MELDIASSSSSFLGLPRELRDIIYQHALVPVEPIEFAPLSFGIFHWEHRQHATGLVPGEYCRYITGRSGLTYCLGSSWHLDRYHKEIQPSLQLLRACKQIHTEASPVYYGQEFRFSNRLGSYQLCTWLNLIGAPNRALVRRLTVAHPALMTMRGEKKTSLALSPLPHDYPAPGKRPKTSNGVSRHYFQAMRDWSEQLQQVRPLEAILQLRELRSLRFLLFNEGFRYTAFYSNEIAYHEINKIDFTVLPHATISLLSLRGHFGGHTEEIAFPETNNEKLPDEHREPRSHAVIDPENFFDALTQQGWAVREAIYDNHFTYPVQDHNHCTNKSICGYLDHDMTVGSTDPWTSEGLTTDELLYQQVLKKSALDKCCRRPQEVQNKERNQRVPHHESNV